MNMNDNLIMFVGLLNLWAFLSVAFLTHVTSGLCKKYKINLSLSVQTSVAHCSVCSGLCLVFPRSCTVDVF